MEEHRFWLNEQYVFIPIDNKTIGVYYRPDQYNLELIYVAPDPRLSGYTDMIEWCKSEINWQTIYKGVLD